MTDIVSVRFKDSGKIYYFSPGEYKISPGEYVIVETARGVECAKAVSGNKTVEENAIVSRKRKHMRYAAVRSRSMAWI